MALGSNVFSYSQALFPSSSFCPNHSMDVACILSPCYMLALSVASPDLHLWTNHHLESLPELFEPISPDSAEFQSDVCVKAVRESTEEGKKVERNKGDKFIGLWRRKENPVA